MPEVFNFWRHHFFRCFLFLFLSCSFLVFSMIFVEVNVFSISFLSKGMPLNIFSLF